MKNQNSKYGRRAVENFDFELNFYTHSFSVENIARIICPFCTLTLPAHN